MVKSVDAAISLKRMGLENSIAHVVTQRLEYGQPMEIIRKEYLDECRVLFVEMLGAEDRVLVEDILDEAVTIGQLGYAMGNLPDEINSGSQVIPRYNPQITLTLQELRELLTRYKEMN